jgi:hypothetical protein
MRLHSAPPHTGPYSGEAHGLGLYLPQQDQQNHWSTDNVNVIYESALGSCRKKRKGKSRKHNVHYRWN